MIKTERRCAIRSPPSRAGIYGGEAVLDLDYAED